MPAVDPLWGFLPAAAPALGGVPTRAPEFQVWGLAFPAFLAIARARGGERPGPPGLLLLGQGAARTPLRLPLPLLSLSLRHPPA